MTNTDLLAALERLGMSQAEFARKLIELGDTRRFDTLIRSLSNQTRGTFPVAGEVRVIINLLEQLAEAGRPLKKSKDVEHAIVVNGKTVAVVVTRGNVKLVTGEVEEAFA
jgi:thioredoxin-like negative regulator of GroEL